MRIFLVCWVNVNIVPKLYPNIICIISHLVENELPIICVVNGVLNVSVNNNAMMVNTYIAKFIIIISAKISGKCVVYF